MKVLVITRHAIANYGSFLQAYATQHIIEKIGYSCEILDYIRSDESYNTREKTLLKRKPEWYNNPIKRALYLTLRQPESIIVGKQFERSRAKYLNLSKRYTSPDDLIIDKPNADIYLTGSDQVWGPVENGTYDSSYCLSFTDKYDKKVAYAASFGHTEMTDELVAYYKKWLSRYNHIAVREDSALEIIKGFGQEVSQVLDPTLLLSEKEWKPLFENIKYKNYVLVYQLHNNKKLDDYAKRVAKAKGLPLIRISASFHQIFRKGKFVWKPQIGEFLSFVKNADCMITDSFHGTAFAINFNTPFVEVLPNNNTGTRNTSILSLTGLSNRILNDENDIQLSKEPIDFSYANKVIKEKREESLKILKNMLKN